jgi:hypothetical protein
MTRLRLGLALSFPVGDELRTALVRLAERCDVVELVDGARVDAVVRGVTDAPAPPGTPTVAWLDRADDVRRPTARTAAALVASPSVARAVRAAGTADTSPVLVLGPQEVHADARPIAPFTRGRIRRARDLGSAAAVVRCVGGTWTWDGRPLDQGAVTTAVALAAVLVTDSAQAAVAGCAWATPVVATPAVSRLLDLPEVPGARDVPTSLDDVADRVRRDPAGLACLALLCRQVYERDHSPHHTVLALQDLLGRTPVGGSDDPFGPTLDGLGTPVEATIRRRAGEALRDLRSYR